MINVTGDVYVTNLKELSPRLLGGTIYSFEKLKDKEEFKTTFIKAKFVGDALTYIIQNKKKDKYKRKIKNKWITTILMLVWLEVDTQELKQVWLVQEWEIKHF